MTAFVFMRHGITEGLEAGKWQGWSPVPLSARGREQARLAGRWLASQMPADCILASPLARAWETAEIISAETGSEIVPCDDLKERMTATCLWDVRHVDTADYLVAMEEHRLDVSWCYEDEEPWSSVFHRARNVVALLRELAGRGERFALVTHGLTLRAIVSGILAGSHERDDHLLRVYNGLASPDCCSFTVFSAEGTHLRLSKWNDTTHLSALASA